MARPWTGTRRIARDVLSKNLLLQDTALTAACIVLKFSFSSQYDTVHQPPFITNRARSRSSYVMYCDQLRFFDRVCGNARTHDRDQLIYVKVDVVRAAARRVRWRTVAYILLECSIRNVWRACMVCVCACVCAWVQPVSTAVNVANDTKVAIRSRHKLM